MMPVHTVLLYETKEKKKFKTYLLQKKKLETNFLYDTIPIFQLDLKLNSDKGGDVTTYVTNGEWDLIGNIHVPSVNIKMLSSMSSESFACMCMSSTYHP